MCLCACVYVSLYVCKCVRVCKCLLFTIVCEFDFLYQRTTFYFHKTALLAVLTFEKK